MDFDLAIVGAGPGGYVTAIRAAQLGMKVALVEERETLGGTCLNVGCVPTKALLESSARYAEARAELGLHGVRLGSVELDLPALLARKDAVVRDVVGGLAQLMRKNRVKVFRGRGTVLGPGRVQVEGPGAASLEGGLLEARHVVVAVGSEPVELPFLPFDGERVVDSTAALSFPEVPRRLVVVGGGAVGLELATAWRRLGSEVAVVEMLPQVAPFADRYAARLLSRALAAQGIELHVNSRVVGLDEAPAGSELPLLLRVQGPRGEGLSLACDRVLVAVGRRALVGAAGLAELGVELERGRVRVDERFQTSVPGVYALGDLVRGPMLAHKAEEEGIALAELLAGREARVDYAAIPSVVYTEPELAQVGLTEEQLKERGIPFRAGRFYFAANARARSMERTAGAIKVLAEPGSGRLLGVHLVGPRVSELVAEAVFAYAHGARAQDLAGTVHAHPTLSEALREAALAVERRSIHG